MNNNKKYNKLANKLVYINDKILEIQPIIKTLDVWVKERDYDLIPIINLIKNKINDVTKILEK